MNKNTVDLIRNEYRRGFRSGMMIVLAPMAFVFAAMTVTIWMTRAIGYSVMGGASW